MILQGSYNTALVLLSVVIAFFAAFTALNLISRLNDPLSAHLVKTRVGVAGLVLGLGIWSMHFVAMLAYSLPVPVRYDGSATVWSLVVAIVACVAGLGISFWRRRYVSVLLGGSVLGLGIASMHYIGMAAMRVPARMQYEPLLVVLSVLIAIGAAITAIWFALAIGRGQIHARLRVKLASSVIMGLAIAGMHYTGMAAMTVYDGRFAEYVASGFEINPTVMGAALTVSAILLMSFALWSSRLVAETNLIRANEEKVSAITENIADVIITINISGTIEFVNAAVEKVFGYTSGELINQNVSCLMPEPWHGKHAEYIQAYTESGRDRLTNFAQRELYAMRKDGSTFPIDLAVSETEVSGNKMFIGTIRDISERIETQQRLHYLAHHDVLTTLPNRLSFQEHIEQSLKNAKQRGRKVAVLFLDVDRFKLINDTLGHHVGDFLLQEVAIRLQRCVRRGDVVSRLSGDEFTILLDDVNELEDIAPIAHKLIGSFSEPVVYSGQELFTTVSIGISIYPDDGNDLPTMMQHADIAMYSAKGEGGSCYRFYSTDMNPRADERLQFEASLRRALERKEFVLHYQPQMDTETGSVAGVEALLRWQHPVHGLIPPLDFIYILEETGLIVSVGEWVIRNACQQHIQWCEAGFKPVMMAVNISARQFNDAELVEKITTILDETGMAPRYLELEITETTLIQQTDKTMSTIAGLHSLGVQLAIDDFGTGYSSLGYLRKLPIHTLKIDRSFVLDITTDPDDAAIVQLILDMANSLKLNVIAEGVETAEQLDFLQKRHCRYVQGYYFSRPVLAEDLDAMLLKTGMSP